MNRHRSLAVAGCTVLILLTCAASPAGSPADRRVLEKAAVRGGVACVPRCGDGAKAIELAQKGEYLVLAMDADPANVAKARAAAEAAGVLGRSLYIEQGSADKIPFADNYVDLLVFDDVAESALSDAQKAEIVRVLTPIHGRAVLKDNTIVKPELPGSDWWPHKLHGPNNNAVSQDTVFKFPPIVQYRALPMSSVSNGASLSANGINYEFNPWTYRNDARLNLCGRLFARSTYNGRILWQSMIPFKMEPNLSVVGLTESELLMASGERGQVIRLDPLTGKELPSIDIGDESVIIRWLEPYSGVLYMLLGRPAEEKTPFHWYLPLPESQMTGHDFFGKELVAWDMKAGKMLWRHEEPADIDYRTVAIHEGKLFFYSEMHRLACLNAADGKLLWENRDKTWLDKQTRPQRQQHAFNARLSSMIVADGIIYLTLQGGTGSDCVFNAEDGKLIGMPKLTAGQTQPQKFMILNGKILKNRELFDPATGNKTGEVPSPAGTAWCGRVTYAPGTGALGHANLGFKSVCSVGAWVAGGVLTYFPSIGDGAPLPGAIGFVSGADIIARAEQHPEHPLVQGPAFASIDHQKSTIGNPNDWATHRGDPGRSGSSQVAVGRGATIVWKTETSAPFAYSTLYNNFVTTFDERPTPPICVGERIFIAGSDGIVRAHALADGKELWRFYADGPVMTGPAWSVGMLFVPGADGWVYALDAASGRLAWKLRLAPMERRIIMFDQLVSTWPVLSLVADGETVFAAAGHNTTEGVKTFALNARTGEVIWSHYQEPVREQFHTVVQPPDRPAQGIGGNMCLVGNRIWAAGYGSVPLCRDKATGKDHQEEVKKYILDRRTVLEMVRNFYQYGQEVVRIDDALVLAGGSDLFENQNIRNQNEQNAAKFRLFYGDADGDWQMEPVPREVFISRFAPACDGELLVWAGPPYEEKKGKRVPNNRFRWASLGLNVWTLPNFRKAANAMQKSSFVVGNEKSGQVTLAKPNLDYFNFAGAAWQKPDLDINDVVLAKNAVLTAHATGRKFKEDRYNYTEAEARGPLTRYEGWRLSAFSRDGKETLWEVDLPSEPLFNGLAIAADGTVIVTLRDGSLVAVKGSK